MSPHVPFSGEEVEARLRQNAEQFHRVLWIEDFVTRHLLYVSPTYESIWGANTQTLLAAPLHFLDSLLPEDRPEFKKHLSRQRRGEFSEMEYCILRPDGAVRRIRDWAFPLYNAAGEIYRTAGVAEDVTANNGA